MHFMGKMTAVVVADTNIVQENNADGRHCAVSTLPSLIFIQ